MMFTEVIFGEPPFILSISHVFILQDIQIAVLRSFTTTIRGEGKCRKYNFLGVYMKMNKVQLKSIVKIADALPYLLTRIFVGITPTEKIYIVLPFINVRKIIRNQKLRIYKSFTDHVETVDMNTQDQTETTTTISITHHKESGVAEITIVLDIVFGYTEWIKLYPHIFPTGAVHSLWIKLKMGIFN